jgi:hypothetical protein
VLLASGVAVVGMRGCNGCRTGGSAADATDAGAGLDADLDARRESGPRQDGTPDSPVVPEGGSDGGVDVDVPDSVPAGWEPYVGWSPDCPLFVPGKAGQMPPPIEWEPCPDPVPKQLACRRMKIAWGGYLTPYPSFALDTDSGAPLLQFTRMRVGANAHVSGFWLVAAIDGPVRTAFFQPNSSTECQFTERDLSDNRYVFGALTRSGPAGAGGVRALEEGVLAGGIDAPTPTTVLKLAADEGLTSSWYMSSDWIVQGKGFRKAWSWDLQTTRMVYDPASDPDGLPGMTPTVRGKHVFVQVGNLARCGVMAWTEDVGIRPLLRWYGDSTHGAGNFGTDGKDMVWTYGQGPNACFNDQPTPEVWAGPYTLDAAELSAKAKRLRSDYRGMAPRHSAYAVGFGYAARAVSSIPAPHVGNGLFIVRLSDGVSWVQIPGSNGLWAWFSSFTRRSGLGGGPVVVDNLRWDG